MSHPLLTTYFAYGSNLSLVQMRARCPNNTYIGLGILRGWTWIINPSGYANIIPSPPSSSLSHPPTSSPNSIVYGLIYTLTPSDKSRLDVYEGVPVDYTKELLSVEVFEEGEGMELDGSGSGNRPGIIKKGNGVTKKVLAYVDRLRTDKGTPKDEYIFRMQRGCREAARKGVPKEWMERVIGEYLPIGGEGFWDDGEPSAAQ